MSLTRETVENIAELAKLDLSDEEIERYRVQLSAVLDYVDMLSGLDTDNILPTASVLPIVNAFREDAAKPSLDRGSALDMAPKAEAGQFSVDAVLEGGE